MPRKNQQATPAQLIEQRFGPAATCRVSRTITTTDTPVGQLYREPPQDENDTGWLLLAEDELYELLDNPQTDEVLGLAVMAEYQAELAPILLEAPVGAMFIRDEETGEYLQEDSPFDPEDLPPESPVVRGEFPLADGWSITLPCLMNLRVEEDVIILSRPGLVAYLLVWGNEEDQPIETRLADLREEIPAEATEIQVQSEGDLQLLTYHHTEDLSTEEEAPGLHGLAIGETGHVQIAVYCFDNAEAERAKALWGSLKTVRYFAGE
ncbi:MAG: DUF2185 domain-containing protein [Pirellulaceae bacterium]